ncbi:MAG: CPBP family intramembrane metalloprotease [Lacunisphaera sp.]|nr:CPBP family intramembrane metalloprotease [Lacunisphaera sp.]
MLIPPDDSGVSLSGQTGRAALHTTGAIAWRITVFFLFWGLLLVPAVLPRVWLQELGAHSPALQRFYFDGTGLLASLGACALMVRWVDRKGQVPLGFGRERVVTGLLGGLAGGAAWLAVSLGFVALLDGVAFAPRGDFGGPALGLAAVSLLLNAAVQEVITRSYVFQLLLRRAGPGWAVLVSSVLFTAMHAAVLRGGVLPAVNVFAASVLFGLVLLRTGRLWAVIAVHFAWNFLVGPVLGLAVSGQDLAEGWRVFSLRGPDWLTGGAFGIEGSLVVTLVTLAACGVVGRWKL